jgi:hypothetical protein
MSYIKFVSISKVGKTARWEIYASDNQSLLGQVKWYSGWRRYCFFPHMGIHDLIFEQDCLREIADFIEVQTRLYKKK